MKRTDRALAVCGALKTGGRVGGRAGPLRLAASIQRQKDGQTMALSRVKALRPIIMLW